MSFNNNGFKNHQVNSTHLDDIHGYHSFGQYTKLEFEQYMKTIKNIYCDQLRTFQDEKYDEIWGQWGWKWRVLKVLFMKNHAITKSDRNHLGLIINLVLPIEFNALRIGSSWSSHGLGSRTNFWWFCHKVSSIIICQFYSDQQFRAYMQRLNVLKSFVHYVGTQGGLKNTELEKYLSFPSSKIQSTTTKGVTQLGQKIYNEVFFFYLLFFIN